MLWGLEKARKLTRWQLNMIPVDRHLSTETVLGRSEECQPLLVVFGPSELRSRHE
jgi:hypothetical protein